MSAHTLLLCAALAAPLAAPTPIGDPVLSIAFVPNAIEFQVTGPSEPFLGVAIASLSPDLVHYLVGLPPLLNDFVVLDFGVGDAQDGYTAVVPQISFPPGILIYAQGATLDSRGISSTNVAEFVLDATGAGG